MIIRSKAPLRLGLAGGGSDVSPYCDIYGGCVLNATIDLYAYCTLIPTNNDQILLNSIDRDEKLKTSSKSKLPIDGTLDLHKGVYNRIIKDFQLEPLSFELYTNSDAPAGSGLGSSSTIVVAILQAFVEWLNLPLGEYDIAQLAYDIERKDIGLSGGKQDQYAATFGGFNFMEFFENDRVIVNPLRIKEHNINELEASILLFNSGISRSSAVIIDDQKNILAEKNEERLTAMHQIKENSFVIKESLLKGDFKKFFSTMKQAWGAKKGTSDMVSNNSLDSIYEIAIKAGAHCGKISGAGGGGFMMLFVDPMNRQKVIRALGNTEGYFVNFHFVYTGCTSWKVNDYGINTYLE